MENESREIYSEYLIPQEMKFIPEKMNALLHIEGPTQIEERVISAAANLKMEQKGDFHLTVIGSKNGRSLLESVKTDSGIEKFIKEQFESQIWEYRLLPEYYHLQKFYDRAALNKSGYGEEVSEHNRYTIIQMAELPDLDSFYKEINKRTQLNLPTPLPHVTLFSGADYEPLASRGIGVESKEDFDKYQPKSI